LLILYRKLAPTINRLVFVQALTRPDQLAEDSIIRYHFSINAQHRKTLEALFAVPVPRTLEWRRIEALFVALGATVIEGRGSRLRFILNGVVGTFHRPHPHHEAMPYQIHDARSFLKQAGITP
jgi:hypothetical protein